MSQKILVFNAGSTSLKVKLFDWPNEKFIWEMSLSGVKNQEVAMKKVLASVPKGEISAIGHRVVHGGSEFIAPTRITASIIKKMARYNVLAPLHNPANLAGIKAAEKIWPKVPQVAVFDTAFFADLPEVAKTYTLPKKINQKYNYRRYGFHGLSHQSAAEAAASALRKPLDELKIITCHLGGGCSLAAIDHGRAVDVSLGWTPMEGVPMITRSGDVDPGIVLDLVEKIGLEKTREILNKQSGIFGLSGQNDFLKLLDKVSAGDKDARLAFEVFVYRIKKYLGAFYAILGDCDAVVFTGAIGAGNTKTREAICDNLTILKKTKILAFPANEELQIAREVANKLLF